MGRRVDPREKIVQICVGLNFRHIEFMNKYPDFKPAKFFREEMDRQIKMIDEEFLTNDK